jgi:hypothetical protein
LNILRLLIYKEFFFSEVDFGTFRLLKIEICSLSEVTKKHHLPLSNKKIQRAN